MIRTRWLAALAAAALIGGSARAQCCVGACPGACTPPAAEPNRAPYYHELTQILYPPQNAPILAPNSNPAVWARLFEVVARNHDRAVRHAHCESGACTRRRHGARDRRMAVELLKLYRFYYRTGHYHAAEFMAVRALQLDPDNVAAEAALCMARKATEACGESEDCEAGTAPGCGKCGSAPAACKGSCTCSTKCTCSAKCACCQSACTCSQGCACCKSACACAAKCCCQKSACCCNEAKCGCAKTSCACGAKCDCCKSSCACGASCACKKSARPKSQPRGRVALPPVMCPFCPFCPHMEVGFPHPLPAMMPPPLPGMAPLHMPQPTWPGMPNGGPGQYIILPQGPAQTAPAAPQREQLPMPRVVNPMVGGLTTSLPTETKHGPIRLTVSEKQVRIDCPCLEARCNTVTSLPDGRALLEGDVTVTFRIADRPARIKARRMTVDLETGAYEVNPARGVEPIRHEQCEPMSKATGWQAVPEILPSGARMPGAWGGVFQQMNSPR